MDAYGICYIIADGEADKLCASLVKTGKAWACLSDDMDMFVYGCPRVLRHMSLLKHNAIIYDFNQILTELNLSEKNFREIAVLSGTDYNVHQNISLFETMRWFNEYSVFSKFNDLNESFYKWLFENETRGINCDELNKVLDMFYLDESVQINQCIITRNPNYVDLHNILKEDGFIMC
jgi:flap endonuclease GEN